MNPGATPLLAIRGLRAAYGKIEALKGIDLDIQAGEIVALIGANGAGKSTLMMTIFGRPRARAGLRSRERQRTSGRGPPQERGRPPQRAGSPPSEPRGVRV